MTRITMVDWDSLPCTEPPLFRDITDEELDEIVEKGHRFEDFPNQPHTAGGGSCQGGPRNCHQKGKPPGQGQPHPSVVGD